MKSAIEVFRHEDGELGVYCEKCDRVNRIDQCESRSARQTWCCTWAHSMYWFHLFDRIREMEVS